MGDWAASGPPLPRTLAEDDDAVPTVSLAPKLPASRFADEDKEEEEVKESWDADDDAEPAKPKPAEPKKKPAAVPAKKAAPAPAGDVPPPNETEAERKLRLQKAVELADLQNASELFGAAVAGSADLPGAATAAEFNKLAATIAEKLLVHERKPEFVPFLERLSRDLCANQKSDDIRKVASILNVLANERQKDEKLRESGPSKKKTGASAKKAVLKTEARGDFEDADGGGGGRYGGHDDYDFM